MLLNNKIIFQVKMLSCHDASSIFSGTCCNNTSNIVNTDFGVLECDTLRTMYQTANCCSDKSNSIKFDFSVNIKSVNGVHERTKYAEPWKKTLLEYTGTSEKNVEWKIEYLPRNDRLFPIPRRMPYSDINTTVQTSTSTLEHIFKFPGDYNVCANNICHVIKNRYVHRYIGDYTVDELKDFADAFNKIRYLSTQEGRETYGSKCLDSDNDFYNHDTFVSMHTFMSSVREHDRLHYLTLQEPAHLSWTMMMQKALRCICPSCSHPYYDPIRDYNNYYVNTVEDMLNSPVWGPDMYGGASNYNNSNTDPSYVIDGAFSLFPITQTKDPDYWCTDLEELTSKRIQDTCYLTFEKRRGTTNVGLTLIQPKPKNETLFVSRRPYVNTNNKNYCIEYIRRLKGSMSAATDPQSLSSLWSYVSAPVHAYGHDCISGKWTHDERKIGYGTEAFGEETIIFGNGKAINVGMWYDENSDDHPCIKCHDTYCECTADCRKLPDSNRWFYEYENDESYSGDIYRRATTSSFQRFYNKNCDWFRSGTFDWSASANQDPAFYLHHYYTFYVNDVGYNALTKKYNKTIIELAETYEHILTKERPGNRLFDTTEFRNLVPYSKSQQEGDYHTWHDILKYQTSYEDFVFE